MESIFAVTINKVAAELEITEDKIKCFSGVTTHFDIPKSQLRSYLHLIKNKIILNLSSNDSLTMVTISSKYCKSIEEAINQK